ncbi:MAG: serine hydrolase [Alcanivoracaceae bacterium]|nr:serine hydrolase [Alcanivoracaceae bacterium]
MKTNKNILIRHWSRAKLSNIILSIILISLALLSSPVIATSDDDKMQHRLEKLSTQLDEKRQEFHIPGMALAIVKDNKVIFSKGFGVSDLGKQTPVTSQTLFAIGSTTKAFTATLIGMLVDEGKIQWDDPVTKYLPYLQFNLENKTEQITLRDMMSHQTGFTRFNILYANGKVDRNGILKAAIKAEPWADFRKEFHYTNLMVVGAGVAAAQSIDSDWETLLEQRLLEPLGMTNTTSNFEKVIQDPQLSKGYMWLTEQAKHKQLAMHDITNIAPAGAINSNVEDMAKWLQLQLANSKYKGKRLISEDQIEETRKPQIKIAAGAHYGLGWMLREYQGQKMVAHDGSVEGYSAIVAMLPESDIGFVLLTNVTSTGLLGVSVQMIWDTLLNESQQEIADNIITNEVETKLSYDVYVGEYIANFGSFNDTIFNFHIKDDKAYVDVPGQMDYELKAPDKNGKMYFTVTDTVSITFDKDDSGNVTALRMQQGGMNFELPKKGLLIAAEIDVLDLQKFLGSYSSKMFNGDLKVFIQNHRLTVDVPGQMAFELQLPDVNGHRHFRIKDTMSIVFETDEHNVITALSLYKSDTKLDTAQRNETKSVEKLPTVAEILQLRQTSQRKKALLSAGGFRIRGTISMAQSGVVGSIESSFQDYNQFREEVDLGQYGSIITALYADGAATAPSFSSFREHHGKYFEQIQKMHPAAMIDWQYFYKDIQVLGVDTINGKKTYILKLKGEKTLASTIFVDAETGDVIKQESKMLNPLLGSIAVTTIYENYHDIHGLRIPYKVTVKNDFNGTSTIELDSIDAGLSFDPSIFILKNPSKGE